MRVIWLLVWCFLAALTGLMVGTPALKYSSIARSQEQTVGHFLQREPHRAVRYAFVTGAQTHTATDRFVGDDSDYEHLAKGDPIPVYYSAKDPSLSCLAPPNVLLRSELPVVAAAMVFIASAGTFFIWFRVRRWRTRGRSVGAN